jgi:hypothetical protein
LFSINLIVKRKINKMIIQCLRLFKLSVIAFAAMLLVGCASIYVDNATKEISTAQFKVPEPKPPVMLVFEFQTKGVANAKATDYLKARVLDQVKGSGIFSEVSLTPVPENRVLSITLNNVPLTDDAFAKGFVTGLTFGLAGSTASDGYICTARYLGGSEQAAIVKQARHAIHVTMGAKGAPANATKAANGDEAVTSMTRQIVSNVLNDLSHDSSFQ